MSSRSIHLSFAILGTVLGGIATLSCAVSAAALEAGVAAPLTGVGLSDQFGRPVTEAAFAGKVRLLYFGYTHCPDLCPTALAAVTRVLDGLPAEVASAIVPVLVAIDPVRDGPETLRDYLAAFHPSILAVTGPVEAIDDIAWRYRVPVIRHPSEGARGYAVDHGTEFVLVDPQGRLAGRLSSNATDTQMATVLTGAVRGRESTAR